MPFSRISEPSKVVLKSDITMKPLFLVLLGVFLIDRSGLLPPPFLPLEHWEYLGYFPAG